MDLSLTSGVRKKNWKKLAHTFYIDLHIICLLVCVQDSGRCCVAQCVAEIVTIQKIFDEFL
jgi:hypothetical protein